MPKIKRTDHAQTGKDRKQLDFSYTAGGNAKLCNPIGKQYGSFFKN